MVLRATVSTMTMPVPAEKPPMKTNSASEYCWAAIGSVSTMVSGSTPAGAVRRPASAIGSTKMLIRKR